MPQATKQDTFSKWVNEHAKQDTFMSAWRNMDNYREEASVRNWLFTILKNKIADHFRKAVNKITIESLEAEYNDHSFFDEHDHWKESAYPQQWSLDFNNPGDAKDFRRIFTSCTRKLKQVHNAVFIMKYVDNIESEIICKELGISSSNYWVILHRAKLQLRACLEKNWLTKEN